MSHERTQYNLEQLEALTLEVPLLFQPVVSVHLVQFEALIKAKKDGKVRFVGFTGHQNFKVHLAMLNTGFPFASAQMPLNVFDSNFRSFEQQVLPELNKRGIAALGMKPFGRSRRRDQSRS